MRSFFFIFVFSLATTVFCENYLLNGGQSSTIKYKMIQKVEPQPGIEQDRDPHHEKTHRSGCQR